ncbi:MAG TPA: thioredoxin domain-containing protein [Anaerolineaceae bacterium]|nr:thioredoxin domain-containing protein [Anaerolineaceae bacterium]HPN50689.1 thioredoxin domain-containing protein [Anaerolineaceae bacterium]
MPNHLAHENSPYLLQHAANPVDWFPWSAEALEKARQEDKPVFLSIGYAACHWCHVMAHESFEDPEIAALLNRYFVCIKVDREERPDLDGIYMEAVAAMTGQGGWPMSVFITPDGRPFYGGTYFPPAPRYGMPSFAEVLLAVARAWREDRENLLESAARLHEHLQRRMLIGEAAAPLRPEILEKALLNLVQGYDWEHGGWGRAPRFPQPMTIEFLLRRAARGDKLARQMAVHALQAMARGGMYDVVGGGFARYATDDDWRVPHFEKMLYDNAQLALVYLHGWQVSGEPFFRRVCEETLEFMLRELADPLGGFYSSLDADSEGKEGQFYLWTWEELEAALPDPDDLVFFTTIYPVTTAGNFEGKNILQRAAKELPSEAEAERLAGLHRRLLALREKRVRPGTDDKVLTAWNALALAAFAEAGRVLGRADFLAAAQKNARFLLDHLQPAGRLLRSWRAGQARHNAYLEDQAALILGLLALYQADGDPAWMAAARQGLETLLAHYADPQGGFFDTRADHEALIIRPKDVLDNATPSGSALAACALLALAAFEGRGDWHARAQAMLDSMQTALSGHPTAFGQWLSAADFALGPVQEVAIIGERSDPRTRALTDALNQAFRPRLVAAQAAFPPPAGSPALLEGRPMLDDQPTAYVCQGFTCRQPVTRPEDLIRQLNEAG